MYQKNKQEICKEYICNLCSQWSAEMKVFQALSSIGENENTQTERPENKLVKDKSLRIVRKMN